MFEVFGEVAAKSPEHKPKASEIIDKSTESSAKQFISKDKFKQSLKVHTQSVQHA